MADAYGDSQKHNVAKGDGVIVERLGRAIRSKLDG